MLNLLIASDEFLSIFAIRNLNTWDQLLKTLENENENKVKLINSFLHILPDVCILFQFFVHLGNYLMYVEFPNRIVY